MDLKDILSIGLLVITDPQHAGEILEGLLDNQGQIAADAACKKVYLQQHTFYAIPDGGDMNTVNPITGKSPLKRLADDTFGDFEHLLRVGGEATVPHSSPKRLLYPGAPAFPGLGFGADAAFADGGARSAIRVWCNTAAKNLLTLPPSIDPVPAIR